jgi:hypothetical protein
LIEIEYDLSDKPLNTRLFFKQFTFTLIVLFYIQTPWKLGNYRGSVYIMGYLDDAICLATTKTLHLNRKMIGVDIVINITATVFEHE